MRDLALVELPAHGARCPSTAPTRPFSVDASFFAIEQLHVALENAISSPAPMLDDILKDLLRIYEVHLFWLGKLSHENQKTHSSLKLLARLVQSQYLPLDVRLHAASCLGTGWSPIACTPEDKLRTLQALVEPFCATNSIDANALALFERFISGFVGGHDGLSSSTEAFLLLGFAGNSDESAPQAQSRLLHGILRVLDTISPQSTFSNQLVAVLLHSLSSAVAACERSATEVDGFLSAKLLVSGVFSYCVSKVSTSAEESQVVLPMVLPKFCDICMSTSAPDLAKAFVDHFKAYILSVSPFLESLNLSEDEIEKFCPLPCGSSAGPIRGRILETSHPVSARDLSDFVLRIPGATCLSLEFDPLSELTTLLGSYVQLYSDIERNNRIGPQIAGTAFPDRLLIPGDTICLHLHYPMDLESLGTTIGGGSESSSSGSVDWGFRCTVLEWKFSPLPQPRVPAAPVPLRTISTTATALGHLLAQITLPPSELIAATASSADLDQRFGDQMREHGDVDVAINAVQQQDAQSHLGRLVRTELFRNGLLPRRDTLHKIGEDLLRWYSDASAAASSSAVAKFIGWVQKNVFAGAQALHSQLEKFDAIFVASALHVHSKIDSWNLLAECAASGNFEPLRPLLLADSSVGASFRSMRNHILQKVQQSAQQKSASAGFSSQSSEVMSLRKGRIYVEVCKSIADRALFLLRRPLSPSAMPISSSFESVLGFLTSGVSIDALSSLIGAAQGIVDNFSLALRVRTEITPVLPLPVMFLFLRGISAWFSHRILSSTMSSISSLSADVGAGARLDSLEEFNKLMTHAASLLQSRISKPSTPSAWALTIVSVAPMLGTHLAENKSPLSLGEFTQYLAKLATVTEVPRISPDSLPDLSALVGVFVAQVSQKLAPSAIAAFVGRLGKETKQQDVSEHAFREATNWVLDSLRSTLSGDPSRILQSRQLLTCLICLLQVSRHALEECMRPSAIRLLIDISSGPLLGDTVAQALLFRVLRPVLLGVPPKMKVPAAASSVSADPAVETIESVLLGLGVLKVVESPNPVSPRASPRDATPSISNPLSPVPFALEGPDDSDIQRGLPLPQRFDFRGTSGPVSLAEDGLLVSHIAQGGMELVLARAELPVPDSCVHYYFEVAVVDPGAMGAMAIGFFPPAPVPLVGMPGWHYGSYGYHSDDGNKFCHKWEGSGASYGPRWVAKDSVVGALLNREERTISFTCNGTNCGVAFANVDTPLCPTVSVHAGAIIRVNFGQAPFKYQSKVVVPYRLQEHHPGENPIEHARANAIYLARFLHENNPKWKESINEFIVSSLTSASRLLESGPVPLSKKPSSSSKKLLAVRQDNVIVDQAYLAAQIMGGFVPILRLGAFVTSTDSRDRGVMCQMSATHAKLLREFHDSANITENSGISFDIVVAEISRLTPVEAFKFDVESFLPVLHNASNSIALLLSNPSKSTKLEQSIEHSSLIPVLSSIRLAISTSLGSLLANPKCLSLSCVKSTILPALAVACQEPLARATALPALKQLVPSSVIVDFSGTSTKSPLLEKKRYLAAIRQHLSLLVAEEAYLRKPKHRRRSSRQMPTKSNTADSEFRKALQAGGFTFADVRKLREAFCVFDLDQDGYISLDEFLVVSNATGSTAKAGELTQAFQKMDAGGTGRVNFLEFVRFSAQAKQQASRKLNDVEKHYHFACVSCGVNPIVGARFTSAVRNEEHLCSGCFISSSADSSTSSAKEKRYKRPWSHLFYKVHTAFPPKKLSSPATLDFVYSSKDAQLPLLEDLYRGMKQPKARRHDGVQCARCHKDAIVGTRFVSLTEKDRSLCSDCEPLELAECPLLVLLVVDFPLPRGVLGASKTPLLPTNLHSCTPHPHRARIVS